MQRLAPVLAGILLSLTSTVHSQGAIPTEVLHRTYLIKVGDVTATALGVDYQGRLYLVTSRHILAGLPVQRATILLWEQGGWKDIPTMRTAFASPLDVDIAVIATYVLKPTPYAIPAAENSKPTIGQQVWYLGYPAHQTSNSADISTEPVVKQGKISTIDATDPDAIVLHIDGVNEPGFAGGPILCWDPNNHSYQILGIVQGSKDDPAHPHSQHVDTNASVNSGNLLGSTIDSAMKTIKRVAGTQ